MVHFSEVSPTDIAIAEDCCRQSRRQSLLYFATTLAEMAGSTYFAPSAVNVSFRPENRMDITASKSAGSDVLPVQAVEKGGSRASISWVLSDNTPVIEMLFLELLITIFASPLCSLPGYLKNKAMFFEQAKSKTHLPLSLKTISARD
jgi:hypothetical protein